MFLWGAEIAADEIRPNTPTATIILDALRKHRLTCSRTIFLLQAVNKPRSYDVVTEIVMMLTVLVGFSVQGEKRVGTREVEFEKGNSGCLNFRSKILSCLENNRSRGKRKQGEIYSSGVNCNLSLTAPSKPPLREVLRRAPQVPSIPSSMAARLLATPLAYGRLELSWAGCTEAVRHEKNKEQQTGSDTFCSVSLSTWTKNRT